MRTFRFFILMTLVLALPTSAGGARASGPSPEDASWSRLSALAADDVPRREQPGPRALPTPADSIRVLVIGDSWAQYMWDDGSHDDVLDRFGLADVKSLSLSLGDDPGPGYTGPEVAVSGSEARQWTDTANYPWLANAVTLLEDNPSIEWIVLSIGGNDMLAGRSDGGWYKDMDLDVPGSEEAVFSQLETNTLLIVDTLLAVRPSLKVMLSSYDYPNFNVGFWCFLFACPKRDDLSRDPSGDLITDAEINGLMVTLEQRRVAWCASRERMVYDNSIGLMHHVYGDGVSGPRVLPKPGLEDPLYEPLPGGNPSLPSLRSVFRRPGGIDADPIHLDFEGYQIKIGHQVEAHLLPWVRGLPEESLISRGAAEDGWTDGLIVDTGELRVGDAGGRSVVSLISFDTSALPAGATVTGASLWLTRTTSAVSGSNPFVTGDLGVPIVDLSSGGFGPSIDLEAADLDAPATVENCARVHGSAASSGYTLRLDFDAAARAAIAGEATTQLRLRFGSTDAGDDVVSFADGDAGTWALQTVATFAEVVGSAAPRLDLHYEVGTAVARDSPPSSGSAGGFRLAAPSPNPFNPTTTVAFTLDAAAADAELTLFDLRGKRVAVLWRGPLDAGKHEKSWDGRDRRGEVVASGVYLVRLRVGTESLTRKLILAK